MSNGMVILNYKDALRSKELAYRCMEFGCIDHIVIVDNCSNDNSYEELLKIKNSNIDVIKSDYNGGFSYGCNYGAKYLVNNYKPEYILFANTDTIFPEENIIESIKVLKLNSQLGMVTTRMKNVKGEEEISAWPFTTFIKLYLNCFWIYRFLLAKLGSPSKYDFTNEIVQEVDVARGSFMLFKTSALIEADYFDDTTFLYAEETIIAKRLAKVNKKIGIINNKWYIHNHNYREKNTTTIAQLRSLHESSLYYLEKYCDLSFFKQILFKKTITYSLMEQSLINKIKKIIKR
ncbi:MAG: glycosyltransferase family 2 protein [Clostridium sp.]|nr:glycosyltransferase family 2 protein [Clostridium sp.]